MSSLKALSLPLIGTLPLEAEREARIKASSSNDNDIEESVQDGDSVCSHIITFLLPALLLIQFASAFATHSASIAGLQWPTVGGSIGLFAVTTFLYQRSLADVNITSVVANLIPEMVTVLVAALIFFKMLPEALLAMVFGMFFMALAVAANCIYLLIYQPEDDECVALGEPLSSDTILIV